MPGLSVRSWMGPQISPRSGVASGPTYLAFEVDPANTAPITLTNNGDGSYTSTRNSGADVVGAALVRSTAAIAGNFLLEMEALVIQAGTEGYLGIDDALPAVGTFYNNDATTLAVVPGSDGYIYPNKPGATALGAVAGGWGAVVGAKLFIERIGTTVNFRAGTSYATSTVKATTTDTAAARYAGFDHYTSASSFKLRFYAL